jgi:hypothetical protein
MSFSHIRNIFFKSLFQLATDHILNPLKKVILLLKATNFVNGNKTPRHYVYSTIYCCWYDADFLQMPTW